MKKIVCKECGSEEILITEQLNPNDDTAIRRYFADAYAMDGGLCFCDSCMEQQRFHVVDLPAEPPADPWRCKDCGSTAVQRRVWKDANSDEIIRNDGCDMYDYYCEKCECNGYLVEESELMRSIEKWFANHLLPGDAGFISDLDRSDFPSDEAFETACKEKWDARDVESKIGIWHELTGNKSYES